MTSWTYAEFCANIMVLDNSIRFVGIVDKKGRIFATAHRPGLTPLLEKEESEEWIRDALMRFSVEPKLMPKVGGIVYASSVYEKVRRATLRFQREEILVVTFEREADHESIIIDKILPLLKEKIVF